MITQRRMRYLRYSCQLNLFLILIDFPILIELGKTCYLIDLKCKYAITNLCTHNLLSDLSCSDYFIVSGHVSGDTYKMDSTFSGMFNLVFERSSSKVFQYFVNINVYLIYMILT